MPLHKISVFLSFFASSFMLCVYSDTVCFYARIKIHNVNSSVKINVYLKDFWKFSSCHLPREVSGKKLFF